MEFFVDSGFFFEVFFFLTLFFEIFLVEGFFSLETDIFLVFLEFGYYF